MDTYTHVKAPLGPIREQVNWYRQRASRVSDEGWVADVTYTDEMGHTYTSKTHLIWCAIARSLGVER